MPRSDWNAAATASATLRERELPEFEIGTSVAIADEAHRSKYGFASNLRDALPNASFISFNGTQTEKTDADMLLHAVKDREFEIFRALFFGSV